MKNTLSLLLIIVLWNNGSFAQEKVTNYYEFKIESHDSGSGDDVFFDNGIMN